jgi:hypothetical protein
LAASSVSGIVKNCGAWGSIAPPITVDIMVVSPCWLEIIPQTAPQQADAALAPDRRLHR